MSHTIQHIDYTNQKLLKYEHIHNLSFFSLRIQRKQWYQYLPHPLKTTEINHNNYLCVPVSQYLLFTVHMLQQPFQKANQQATQAWQQQLSFVKIFAQGLVEFISLFVQDLIKTLSALLMYLMKTLKFLAEDQNKYDHIPLRQKLLNSLSYKRLQIGYQYYEKHKLAAHFIVQIIICYILQSNFTEYNVGKQKEITEFSQLKINCERFNQKIAQLVD